MCMCVCVLCVYLRVCVCVCNHSTGSYFYPIATKSGTVGLVKIKDKFEDGLCGASRAHPQKNKVRITFQP